MAGEVIRDVVIRVSLQQGDTKALGAVKGATDAVTTATQAATRAATVMGQEQVKQLTPVERELEKTERLIKEIGEEYARTGRKAGAELDTLIKRQKDLNRLLAERDRIVAGDKKPKDPKPGGAAQPFGGALQGLEAASGALSKVAIPVAVMSMVPAVAEQISGGMRSFAYSIFGTAQEAQEKGSPFLNSLGSTNRVTGTSGVGDFAGLAMNDSLGRILMNSLGPLTGAADAATGFSSRFQESRNAAAQNADPNYGKTAFDILSREVQLREQGVALLEQSFAKEKAALDKQLSLTDDRIRMNQAVIEAEEARLNAAKQQFGLLDATERGTFKSAAEKAKSGDLGGLSKEELGLLKGNQAFQGLFQDEAMQSADAAGWKEIVESLGLDDKIKAEEAQLELNLQQKMEITADISNVDAVVNKFRDTLVEVQRKLADEMLEKVRLEIARAAREAKPASGPNF